MIVNRNTQLRCASLTLAALLIGVGSSSTAFAQLLYSQDFQIDDTANWIVNDGPTDEFADFFFDYSSATSTSLGHVGLPPAPNSDPGEVINRGMFLQANLLDGIFGGFSVSPIGQSFTGDYALTFDLWSNYIGPLMLGGEGQTNLSTYGILTAGDNANYPGAADGVWFANTLDGGSAADIRAYSSERPVSYQLPPDPAVPEDLHATYTGESRNQNDPVYEAAFPSVAAPAAQLALYPSQTEMTRPGVVGMAWHEVEIAKLGDIVTWKMDGTLLVTIDVADFTTPTGGTNILFGHSDTNSGVSSDPNAVNLTFTLIDNIEVNVFTSSTENADFNGSDLVDGADFLAWQRNFEITDGTAQPGDGDANGDMNVTAADLDIWEKQYGTDPAAVGNVGVVPEPTTGLLTILVAATFLAVLSPRQRLEFRRI